MFATIKAKLKALLIKAEDPVHRELSLVVHELVEFLEARLPAAASAVGGALAGPTGAAAGAALGTAAEAVLEEKTGTAGPGPKAP